MNRKQKRADAVYRVSDKDFKLMDVMGIAIGSILAGHDMQVVFGALESVVAHAIKHTGADANEVMQIFSRNVLANVGTMDELLAHMDVDTGRPN